MASNRNAAATQHLHLHIIAMELGFMSLQEPLHYQPRIRGNPSAFALFDYPPNG